MRADAEAYLHKAHESLAAAEADFDAGRYNAGASRAYYASFQAAVAMLIEEGIRPRASWEHRFVISQISGKLISRRKRVPTQFRGTLNTLLNRRLVADYDPQLISARGAKESTRQSAMLVRIIGEALEG